MDHIVLKTNKFRRLDYIARLTAEQLFEEQHHVVLIASLDMYIKDPSDENKKRMEQEFMNCKRRLSRFEANRQSLFMMLTDNGNIQSVKPEVPIDK